MSQEDRKQSRSSKKVESRRLCEENISSRDPCLNGAVDRQAEAAQELVSKLSSGLGNKYEKAKMMRDIQGAKNDTTATGVPLAARTAYLPVVDHTTRISGMQAGSTFLLWAVFLGPYRVEMLYTTHPP
ncbi:unnamed protein product [Ectocarpus sp. 13 AM-2016]